ncbi:YqgE/AlgH family protein [Paracoccus aerodenitrificans]|uniref:YqgE/AlgH family protein n=1 Tax=Paracoccus aerodenitrificans TaxID=3017781 RepID=UPI0022F0A525|nr:YqgE/AlgH family protein [Paracoccus aerodenitrificans]WBU64006.1 YqgE/AlgH family protein [Paracoccus aerodenitrificans]
MSDDGNLSGKILIAMPDMGDPRFAHSVVLVCAHSAEGAMGIVLNQRMQGMTFNKLLEMLGIEATAAMPDLPVRVGGPVEPVRGFLLHPGTGVQHEGTMDIGSGLAMSTTRDMLVDLAEGRGPDRAMLALGYAGWGPGQLDAEIRANGWLTGEMDPDYAFGDVSDIWVRALNALGVDPLLLSGAAGRA